jgi:Zn-dependent M28 family amino/carboxypeptidase
MRTTSAVFLLALLTACGTGEGKLDSQDGVDTDADTDVDTDAEEPGGGGDEDPETLVDRMDVDRLLGHLDALQAIADAQDDTRVVGSPGYEESAVYIAGQLEDAGYAVTWQEFEYRIWYPTDDPTLEALGTDYEPGSDIALLSYTPGGAVSGNVTPVDVIVPISGSENTSTSGCESGDFTDFPAGDIALIQRGSCAFIDKAMNAQDAGAIGVIVFNEGQSGRRGVVEGTLGDAPDLTIPVLGVSYAVGVDLVEAAAEGTVEASMVAEVVSEARPTWNLIADLQGQSDDLVVVGGHLDSVSAGPGINDNGSGSALVLELALQSAELGRDHQNTLRFAWWGAEEAGLIGSSVYVDRLTESELEKHVANLNFDMVASPNGGRFIYDGDNSDTSGGFPAPVGSDLIEDLFTEFLDGEDLSHAPTAFDGRSDYGPFIYMGIPAGGLFSGAEMPMSAQQADIFDAESGRAMDACYHQGCDDDANIDTLLFLDMARAAAHATESMADITDLGARRSRGVADPSLERPGHHAADLATHGSCGGPDLPER